MQKDGVQSAGKRAGGRKVTRNHDNSMERYISLPQAGNVVTPCIRALALTRHHRFGVDANMTTRETSAETAASHADSAAAPRKDLPPAAQRALAEAAERRKKASVAGEPQPKEVNGREGPDPARYGDWENRGIVSDF